MNRQVISSRANAWVQQWLRWQSKPAQRKLAQVAWLSGEHLVYEALRMRGKSGFELSCLVIPNNPQGEKAYLKLIALFPEAALFDLNCLGAPAYDALNEQGSAPALCATVRFFPLELQAQHPTVVLDGVQDPGNVGVIARLCAAFGVPQLLTSPGSASPWSTKALRAGQGAQLGLRVIEDVDLQTVYPAFRESKIPIAVTCLDSRARNLNHIILPKQMVWVFGNEGQGIGSISEAAASERVYLPMQGGFESLNVASAAAICLWEWQQAE